MEFIQSLGEMNCFDAPIWSSSAPLRRYGTKLVLPFIRH